MKSFKINLEDRAQFGVISRKSLGRGRLKKGFKRKIMGKMGLRNLDDKFYFKIENLKEKDIDKFILDYQVTLPWERNGSNFAVKDDIIDFQKDLHFIVDGIKKFKMLRKSGMAATYHTVWKKTDALPGLINKYLVDCHLQIDFPPVLPRQPSDGDLKSYNSEINNFTPESSGILKNNIFIKNGKSTNFTNLTCRCGSLLSWCVLDLVVDLLVRNEKIRVCKNCGRLFEAHENRVEYCKDKSCQTKRARKRQLKSRRTVN